MGLLDLWPVLAGMIVQTVILARVSEARINALAEGVREAKDMAGKAHRRLDVIFSRGKA